MKWSARAAWISYFLFFLLMSLGNLIELVNPDARAYIFYHALMTFDRMAVLWYAPALAASALAIISLWPLYTRAFSYPPTAQRFFRTVFTLRVAADLCGHRYEVLFFKSAWLANPLTTSLAIITALALTYPSYKALYDHGFKK